MSQLIIIIIRLKDILGNLSEACLHLLYQMEQSKDSVDGAAVDAGESSEPPAKQMKMSEALACEMCKRKPSERHVG